MQRLKSKQEPAISGNIAMALILTALAVMCYGMAATKYEAPATAQAQGVTTTPTPVSDFHITRQSTRQGQVTVSAMVLTDNFPADHETRHRLVNDYLAILGQPQADIDMWICIMEGESRGTYHDPETIASVPVGSEYAYGMWQILPSTANGMKRLGYGCEGDIQNGWLEQTKCAVDIKEKYGFSQWEAYYSYCGGK